MLIALIHWRIKPDNDSREKFLNHWKTRNTIDDRSEFIAEFLSDSLPAKEFPYITWHLDGDSLGDFKSYVTVGIWATAEAFHSQIAGYFNDEKPLEPFEKYRRRRVVLDPVSWRIGVSPMPSSDSADVA